MSEKKSVLVWSQADQAQAPSHPPIERFKSGGKKTILLLGDPMKRDVHWNKDLKCSVPCFKPAHCPFCNDPAFTKTARLEGYAPAMAMNLRARQWEQCVAVFTKGGCVKLDDIKRKFGMDALRGSVLEVAKPPAAGATAPMDVVRRDTAPADFPLPREFNVKHCMELVWELTDEPLPDEDWIEPIKVERRRRTVDAIPTMQLDAEKAVLLAERLKKSGLKNFAKGVESELTGSAPAEPEAEAETAISSLKPGGVLQREAISNPANYGEKIPVQNVDSEEPLVSDASKEAIRQNRAGAEQQQPPAKPSMFGAARRRVEQEDSQARRDAGRKSREDGVSGNRLTSLGDVVATLVPQPSTNGHHADGEKGGTN